MGIPFRVVLLASGMTSCLHAYASTEAPVFALGVGQGDGLENGIFSLNESLDRFPTILFKSFRAEKPDGQ